MRGRNDRRRRNEYSDGIYSTRDDLYRTNARDYREDNYYDDVEVSREDRRRRSPLHGEEGSRRGRLRHTRAGRNLAERAGDRIHDAWDRFSNHDDRSYEWEYDNARLEREYGEGTRAGYGYSRFPAEEYGDYRSGPIDDLEYYEDVRHRPYDDRRYDGEGGYRDAWRGERNFDRIRHPRPRRRSRRERY